VTESYKHSILLRYKINYGGKKFWGRGPVSDTKKQRKKTFRQTYLFPGPGFSQNVLRSFLTRVSIGKVFMAKMSPTAARASHYCTYLGLIGQCNTNRNDPVCVAPPKVAKASKKSVAIANVFINKIRQCTQAFKGSPSQWPHSNPISWEYAESSTREPLLKGKAQYN
jgi:hypothetical protein